MPNGQITNKWDMRKKFDLKKKGEFHICVQLKIQQTIQARKNWIWKV
jgi:hypothetical protein